MKRSLLNFRLDILFDMSRGTKTEGAMEDDDAVCISEHLFMFGFAFSISTLRFHSLMMQNVEKE